jgi:hypothetical protein
VRPYLEKPFTKLGLVEWAQGEGPEFKPNTKKKKKLKFVCSQIYESLVDWFLVLNNVIKGFPHCTIIKKCYLLFSPKLCFIFQF